MAKRKGHPLAVVFTFSIVAHIAALAVVGGIVVWHYSAPEEPVLEVVNKPIEPKPPEVKLDPSKSEAPPPKIAVPPIDLSVTKVNIPDVAMLGGRGSIGSGLGSTNELSGLAIAPTTVKIDFAGIPSSGRNFVFIVDYSRSLSKDQETLMRYELEKVVSALDETSNVVVIFFAGPTWEALTTQKELTSWWGYKKGSNIHQASPVNDRAMATPEWLPMTNDIKRKLIKSIRETRKATGTRWDLPFKKLKGLNPGPDVIYFMTDGDGRIDSEVKDTIRSWKKDPVINAIAMPDNQIEGKKIEPKLRELVRLGGRTPEGDFGVVKFFYKEDIEKQNMKLRYDLPRGGLGQDDYKRL